MSLSLHAVCVSALVMIAAAAAAVSAMVAAVATTTIPMIATAVRRWIGPSMS